MVASKTPTIAKIKNKISLNDARALLSIAICEVCDFFNIGKNMNDTQIALTVDLIIESFWYMKLEEIKYCLHRAMMREKVFDRLDGNIIIGWLREYDSERTEEAMRVSEHEETLSWNENRPDSSAVTFEEYQKMLRQRDDDTAREILASMPPEEEGSGRKRKRTKEEERKFKFEYEIWKQNYLRGSAK